MSANKFHFPNLNGLRFIAALLVIICHFHQRRADFGIDNLTSSPIIVGFGITGVNIFFVLSGFLITTLLLREKLLTGIINLKNFYVRRILRIWPLYFFIIGLCFFVVPHIPLLHIPGIEINQAHFWHSLIVFSLILPAFAMKLFGDIPLTVMTWSIGVEEVFYLITPLLLKFTKYILTAFLLFALVFLFLGNGFIHNESGNKFIGVIILFLADLRLTCLALGSIAAIVWHKYPEIIKKFILNIPVQIIFYALTILSLLRVIYLETFNNELFSFFVTVIVFNLALNENSLLKLSHPVFEYLGKISYGIYMYHLFPMVLFCNLIPNANAYLVFLMDIAVTIGLASLSYTYFEGYFLKLKHKF